MNSLKLLNIVMLCMAIVLVSCTGEDGAQGIPGTNGTNGTNGADGANGSDGVDGTDGLDGNANVIRFDFDLSEFDDNIYTADLSSAIPSEEISNFAFLTYVQDGPGVYYIIPGQLAGSKYAKVTYSGLNAEVYVTFYSNEDDQLVSLGKGEYVNLTIVAIEAVNTPASKISKEESIKAELKTAGVDVNDYQAVADYFGLE